MDTLTEPAWCFVHGLVRRNYPCRYDLDRPGRLTVLNRPRYVPVGLRGHASLAEQVRRRNLQRRFGF